MKNTIVYFKITLQFTLVNTKVCLYVLENTIPYTVFEAVVFLNPTPLTTVLNTTKYCSILYILLHYSIITVKYFLQFTLVNIIVFILLTAKKYAQY